ncbi:peptidyl-prolyl cis-trans isomerase [Aliiroseovarius sp. YM-037]|uniref:peptidyl-prolyl cis-trans isomerase n=1 Tax=Aliiroseovarius sp. YM-037 TaxID=3341728 RepID=UPI003A80C5D8
MSAKKSGSVSKVFVWIILLLLIVGLGGFGVSNFGGAVRSVGSVGDREISVQRYSLALQEELQAMSQQTGQQVSLQQADQVSQLIYGVSASDRVFAQLVTTAALDNEADRLGISVGDEQVREQVVAIPDFRGLDGEFDREAYSFVLERQGLTTAEFEEDIRDESARTLLQAAVVGGVPPSPQITSAILGYVGEQRSFGWTTLDASALEEPLPEPTQAELEAYYDANPDEFTKPEVRRISYAWLRPETLLDTIEVDDTILKNIYDERSDEFLQPERRLVERLVFEDDAAAQAASERLAAGEVSFDDLVAERGLTLADIDMGDVTAAELGDASDAVFSLAEPGDVTEPAQSNLGPALYRMNGILNAQEVSFEDAREDLKEEYSMDQARRAVAERASGIEDLLAGGATLEELADETEMEFGQIDWTRGLREGIAAYDDFRSVAAAVTEEDFAEVLELEDGGIFAMRLDETVPPTLQPFEDVRNAVIVGWEAQTTLEHLHDMAEDFATRLADGESASDLGLVFETETGLTRDGFVDGTPPDFNEKLFEMETGAYQVMDAEETVLLVRLDSIAPPDEDAEDTVALKAQLEGRVAQSLVQDIFAAYARSLQTNAGLTRNQSAINAVHAQFP